MVYAMLACVTPTQVNYSWMYYDLKASKLQNFVIITVGYNCSFGAYSFKTSCLKKGFTRADVL